MLDEERERAKGGFKIKPTEKQLTLGPLKEPLVDATVWTKEPNEYISSISDILPKFPLFGSSLEVLVVARPISLPTL